MRVNRLVSLLVLSLIILSNAYPGTIQTGKLICEYKTNPVGLDVLNPRLGWMIVSNERNVMQTAYQLRVAGSPDDLLDNKSLLWNPGKKQSDQSIQVVYTGPQLKSGKRYFWQVKIWDNKGNVSEWSDIAYWEMGLLNSSDWKAKWIQPDLDENVNISNPCPLLRKEFKVKGNVVSARAYISAHGLYEAELNGKKVGDQVFTPGWTSYHNRIQYQTYDVTELLHKGKNAVGVVLGDGWYRGTMGWGGRRNAYGNKLALILQIVISYSDGKTEVIRTDDSWKASTGPVLLSDIYNGEIYDARLEHKGWSSLGFDDKDWPKIKIADIPKNILICPQGPPVKRIQEIHPVAKLITPLGETVFDMGQNMVGKIRIKVKGTAGSKVTLYHAEVLDKDGNFYTENLRSAKQRVQYILKGEGEEIYEPHFTFQGFRYVKVEDYPGELSMDDLTGIVIHSDIEPTGSFSCSNPLLNQLQHNIQWGQKGNFLDVPTDCPQRDERLGWTGDAQVFSRAACFNGDVAAFFTKWLADLSADQFADGRVPHVVPNVLGPNSGGSAGWADASTIIPWNVYQIYGDKRILDSQYSSMVNWVNYMENEAGEDYLWNTGPHFGDWLFYSINNDVSGRSAVTNKYLIAQAFFAHSTELLYETAKVLGKMEDERKYLDLLKNVKQAFLNEYVTPNGNLVSGTQTAYVLALEFDLLPEEQQKGAIEKLVKSIKEYKDHLTTGFLGTPYLCHVLSDHGYPDVSYKLLLQETYPSWLYPVKMGATTIWERWDGIRTDGSFEEASMNSFNHYAYGAIGDWMYRVIGGINADEKHPGYKHIIIHPRPGGDLEYAKTSYQSGYGKILTFWKREGDTFRLRVIIPVNTTASVILPQGGKPENIRESGKPLNEVQGILSSKQDIEDVLLELGSGDYDFTYTLKD
jgi:alpha-L-rhamnosidase